MRYLDHNVAPVLSGTASFFSVFPCRTLLPRTLKQWLFHLSLSMTEDSSADGRLRVVINRAKALRAAEGLASARSNVLPRRERASGRRHSTAAPSADRAAEDTRAAEAAGATSGVGAAAAVAASSLVGLKSVFGQLYAQLSGVPAKRMRTHGRAWYVLYEGEGGIDAGGIYRDSITHIAQELQSSHSPLFMPCPNSRGFGDNQVGRRSCIRNTAVPFIYTSMRCPMLDSTKQIHFRTQGHRALLLRTLLPRVRTDSVGFATRLAPPLSGNGRVNASKRTDCILGKTPDSRSVCPGFVSS